MAFCDCNWQRFIFTGYFSANLRQQRAVMEPLLRILVLCDVSPFAFAVLAKAKPAQRLVAATFGIMLGLLLPADMVRLGLVWVAGAIAAIATPRVSKLRACLPFWTPPFAIGVLVLTLLAAVHPAGVINDLTLGCLIAALLPFLSSQTPFRFAGIAAFGAEMSYSLYLFHFPLVIMLSALILPDRLPPSAIAFAIFFGVIAIVFVSSIILWAIFERRTPQIYKFFVVMLHVKFVQ